MPDTQTKPTPAANRRTPLESARDKREIAEQNLQAEVARRRTKIVQEYDVLKANRARRQPAKETKDEGKIYDMTRRALGCNLGRDLERNYSPARSLLHQFRVNVVGSLGKMRLNISGGEEAADWFNGEWSKDCDFRSDLHWSDWLANTIAAIIREGDQLTVFDDQVTGEDTGKLLTWESDQIAPLTEGLLKGTKYDGAVQDNGILRDELGREVAYIATGKRGMIKLDKKEDFTIYPRGMARLMCNPWRQNQGRGIPALVTAAGNFVDMYELLASELQTAKRAAKQYAHVKRADAVTNWDDPTADPEFLPENAGQPPATVDAAGANETTGAGARNYEQLEAMAGGLVDYVDPADSIVIEDPKHPNANVPAFMDAVHGFSGSSMGIASAYTKLRADKSYTAFRGDMIMTWVTFYYLQKKMERIAADWVGVRAVQWAARKGIIGEPEKGWQSKISWTWPKMPEVDQLDYEQAVAQGLKNGTLDFAALLGPDWERRLEDYAKQVDKVRELGLPLDVLEGKSGGIVNPKKNGSAAEGQTGE